MSIDRTSISANISLVGDKALERELFTLTGVSRRKIMRPAISQGLTPIRKRAVQLAKSNFESDTIAKHIKKSVKKAKRGSGIVGQVFIEHQKDRTITVEGREVPFEVVSNILEFGRKDGTMPAKSFMRRAREEMGSEALNIVKDKIDTELKKQWSKGKLKLK